MDNAGLDVHRIAGVVRHARAKELEIEVGSDDAMAWVVVSRDAEEKPTIGELNDS